MQVQKHAEKLQYVKEQAALAALTDNLPGLAKAVYAVALQELDWDQTSAAKLLSEFQQAQAVPLQDLKKVAPLDLRNLVHQYACCARLHQ